MSGLVSILTCDKMLYHRHGLCSYYPEMVYLWGQGSMGCGIMFPLLCVKVKGILGYVGGLGVSKE